MKADEDVTARIRAGFDQYCSAASLPSASSSFRPAGEPRVPVARRALVPVGAALAVLLVLVAGLVLPRLLPHGGAPAGRSAAGGPMLPSPLAGLSLRTASVSDSPPGQVSAVYEGGLSVDLPYGQTVAVSAHGDVYRRLTDAEDRGPLGAPAPTVLSPDGRRLVIGGYGGDANLAVLDLGTGRVRTYRPGVGRTVEPLAWSPDRRYVAYLTSPRRPPAWAVGTDAWPDSGELGLLDLRTGRSTDLPAYRHARAAAFAPGSDRIAVQDGDALRVIDVRGAARRSLPEPKHRVLAGPAAWSPDGRLLATVPDTGDPSLGIDEANRLSAEPLVFLDATGAGRAPRTVHTDPDSPELDGFVLGWRSADEYVVRGASGRDTRYGDDALVSVSVSTGHRRVLGRLDHGDHEVSDLQLATGLVPELRLTTPGEPDRGPLPTWIRLLPLGPALLVAGVLLVLRRRGHRR